jgi:hypothetical protein
MSVPKSASKCGAAWVYPISLAFIISMAPLQYFHHGGH